MTETVFGPPPPPPPPPDERKLVRSPDEKVVAGVCAAFGRYTDTDPVLWRVTVAVLTLFGGAGLALYALGWLLVPETGQSQSLAERTLRRPDNGLTVAGIVLLVVGGIVLIGLLDNGPGLPALLVIGGLAYLVARERREHPVAPAAWQPPPTTEPYGPPPSWSDPPEGWVPPPAVRERSPLGPVTLSVAAVVAGLLLALSVAGVDGVTAPRILAAALLVVGAGLLLGSWFGRARWLIAVGLVLAVALAATATTQRLELDGGVGERTWVATAGSSDYTLGAGEGILDLRDLEPGERAEISATIGMGSLVVLVPEGLSVRVESAVDMGEIERPQPDALLGRDRRQDGTRLRESFVVGDGPPTVELDLKVRLGEIVVRHASS